METGENAAARRAKEMLDEYDARPDVIDYAGWPSVKEGSEVRGWPAHLSRGTLRVEILRRVVREK